MRPSFRWLSALALAILLAGCGTSTTRLSGKAATPSSLPTATPKPTATPSPTSTPTATSGVAFRRCRQSNARPGSVTVSDIVVSPANLGALAYPGEKLPDNTPLKPILLASAGSDPSFTITPVVNPHLRDSGLSFGVCNASPTTAHTITSVSGKLMTAVPYAGQLNEWDPCTGAYTRSTTVGGGCGGGEGPTDEGVLASFPAGSEPGTMVTTTQQDWVAWRPYGNEPQQMGPLPLSLAPGEGLLIRISIDFPSASGTYTFNVGVSVDGGQPGFVSAGPEMFLAPIVHAWSGKACLTPTMQAQIPPDVTNPPTYYLCPNA